MDYRRSAFPWIIAALFFGAAVLFAALAQQGMGPGDGIGWAIASFIQATIGVAAVIFKVWHGGGSQ